MKLGEKFERLRRTVPHRSQYGQLYNKKSELKKKAKRITLYTLFESDENTHLLLPHVFKSERALSGKEWSEHFAELVSSKDGRPDGPEPRDMQRLTWIHRNRILAGIAIRTGKQWSVQQILGWISGARK